ncbi:MULTISPECIES: hypothetical protein [unclassified Streptomyces]|uniref:hypothetical protein n=1 Tax=unclassified Streptomyces TaxID=2593676 RepID=UPI0037F55F8D
MSDGSEARRRLSLLIEVYGADGALVVRKDPAPPPDEEPPSPTDAELSERVAERNRRSSRGGV